MSAENEENKDEDPASGEKDPTSQQDVTSVSTASIPLKLLETSSPAKFEV